MENYKNIIWDWNGTLLNDVNLCLSIANGMLANHQDTPIDLVAYRNAFGFPITGYYEKIGIDLAKESFDVLTNKFVVNFNQRVKNCALHDGVLDILQQFKVQQKQQYILTAAHLDFVTPLINNFEIHHYFKVVKGVENFKAEGKAARGVKMMEEQQIQPSETVLIGDTYHDFEVANAMGVDCILVANGHQSRERLVDFTENKILIVNELSQLF